MFMNQCKWYSDTSLSNVRDFEDGIVCIQEHVIMLMFVNHNHRFAGKRTKGSEIVTCKLAWNNNIIGIWVNNKGDRVSKYG